MPLQLMASPSLKLPEWRRIVKETALKMEQLHSSETPKFILLGFEDIRLRHLIFFIIKIQSFQSLLWKISCKCVT